MPTSSPASGTPRGLEDPIRVVPLRIEDAGAAPASGIAPKLAPKLTYRGGPLLSAVEVYTMFWGAAWQTAPNTQIAVQVNQFFDFVVTSPLLDQMAEYGAPGKPIGHGTHAGTATVTTPAPGQSIDDGAIQRFLQQEISTNAAVPQPTPSSLYFIFLPPGVAVTMGGGSSCSAFCGYHSDIGGQIFFAVMPFPDCGGCLGGLALLDSITATSSHELCEAITDPVPGQGWYDDQNGEIGDICAWKTKRIGAYSVQLEWSNQAATCI
ncbi:MAG: hypothetical protein ACHQ0J_05810 [Candidatus Dormibacterales bacterium]